MIHEQKERLRCQKWPTAVKTTSYQASSECGIGPSKNKRDSWTSFFKIQDKHKWKLLPLRLRIHPGYLIPPKHIQFQNRLLKTIPYLTILIISDFAEEQIFKWFYFLPKLVPDLPSVIHVSVYLLKIPTRTILWNTLLHGPFLLLTIW